MDKSNLDSPIFFSSSGKLSYPPRSEEFLFSFHIFLYSPRALCIYLCVFHITCAEEHSSNICWPTAASREFGRCLKKNNNNNDIIRSSTQRRSRQFQPKISPCGPPPSVSKSQIHIRKLRCCCGYNEAKVKSPFDICQYSIIVAIFSAAVVVNPIE